MCRVREYSSLMYSAACHPLTGEIRLRIFGSPDLSVFLRDLVSAGDSVYSCETAFEISGTPVKTRVICTGTWVKTRSIFLAIVIISSPLSSVCGMWIFEYFFDLLTPYTHFPVMMCRVREYCSLMYSAAWYHVHILTPYTPSPASMCRVSVSQKNIRILPCSRIHSTWIFSRPAHRVWFWQSQRLSRRCCDKTIRERRWGKRQSQTLRQSRARYGLRV